MMKEREVAQPLAHLVSDVFCECRSAVQADVGRLAGELFCRVEIEDQRLQVAADALGLSTGDARAVLFLFRSRMAGALVGSVSACRVPKPNPTGVPDPRRN